MTDIQTASRELAEAIEKKFAEHGIDFGAFKQFVFDTFTAQAAEIVQLKADVKVLKGGDDSPETPPGDTTPTPDEDPTPTGIGVWADVETIKNMPTHYTDAKGVRQVLPEWKAILDLAYGNWQRIGFFLDAQGGQQMVAGMIVYIVTGDETMLTKVVNQMHQMLDTPDDARFTAAGKTVSFFTRTLELGRYLKPVVYVADWLNQRGIKWRRDDFGVFAARMVTHKLPGHSGFFTILESGSKQFNNWSGHARGSVIAVCLYFRRYGTDGQKAQSEEWLPPIIRAFKRFIGEPVDLGFELVEDKHWHRNGWYPGGKDLIEPVAFINPRGTTIPLIGPDGVARPYNVSGVNLMDRLRAEIWPTHWMGKDMDTGYDSEGGQTIVSQYWLLWRAGLIAVDAGDHALERWNDWLHGKGEAAANVPVYAPGHEKDDNWVNHILKIMLPHAEYELKPDLIPGKGDGFSLIFREAVK